MSHPRRRVWVIATLAVFGAAVMIAVTWLSRPDNLAPVVLGLASDALGLQITAAGPNEYRLRETPQLVLRGVDARQPGASVALLQAERVLVSLPWSTLRARGAVLDATRVELDAPVLDLAATRRWLASRPPGDRPLPTLTRGLGIIRGRIQGDGWTLQDLAIELPVLDVDLPLRAQVSGRYAGAGLGVPFDIAVAMVRPAPGNGLGIAGELVPQSGDWKLPSTFRLSAMLHTDGGARLENALLSAHVRHQTAERSTGISLGLAGSLRQVEGGLALRSLSLALRGAGLVPVIDAQGAGSLGDTLQLELRGELAGWPQDWPALPPPLGQSTSPLPFALEYEGDSGFGDIATLQLSRDQSRFDARLRPKVMAAWVTEPQTGSMLPPLAGTLLSPRMEVSGASLEGVELTFEDPTLPAASVAPP